MTSSGRYERDDTRMGTRSDGSPPAKESKVMHELELARIIHTDRVREATATLRWRGRRERADLGQPSVTDVSAATSGAAGIASTVRACAPSARTSAGPSHS